MMRAAFRESIPVCWFSYGGWFQGIAEGLPSKHVDLRRRQVAIAATGRPPDCPIHDRGQAEELADVPDAKLAL